MFGRRYILSCNNCLTEHLFNSKKRFRQFRESSGDLCPKCREHMSQVPLMRTVTVPSLGFARYERDVRIIQHW